MKKYYTLSSFVVLALIFSGCTKQMRENLNELSTVKREQVSDVNKEEFLLAVNEQLLNIENEILKIDAGIEKNLVSMERDQISKWESLKEKQLKLENQLMILKNVSDENWDFVKEAYDDSIEYFQIDFNSFIVEL